MNLVQAPTVRNYIVFNNAIAMGFDREKCINGIEDLTRLKDIDDSKPWCEKLVACKIISCPADEAMKSYDEADVEYTRINKDI